MEGGGGGKRDNEDSTLIALALKWGTGPPTPGDNL